MDKIKQLLQLIDECEDIERETKSAYFLQDQNGIERNQIAKKLRKKTEKAIFKLLRDE